MAIYMWRDNPRLPSEYQEVEYIESSGTQYIDTTYTPNLNIKIACKFAHNEHSSDTPVFWVRNSWDWSVSHQNGYVLWSHPSEYWSNDTLVIFAANEKSVTRYAEWTEIEFEYDKSNWKYWNQTWTWNCTNNYSNVNMVMFGLRDGTSIDSRKFKWKMFYFKIWDDWILVRDFIPCYRKSDTEIWMYDLVTNTFYTNQGTGTFTKWSDVN